MQSYIKRIIAIYLDERVNKLSFATDFGNDDFLKTSVGGTPHKNNFHTGYIFATFEYQCILYSLKRKALSTPATMSKQHCRMPQVERFFLTKFNVVSTLLLV